MDEDDRQQQQQSLSGNPPAVITKTDRVRFLALEAKASIKDKLHSDERKRQSSEHGDIFDDAAFDPQKVLQNGDQPKPSVRERLSQGAKSVGGFVKNPKAVSRNNYARHAAAKIANHPQNRMDGIDDELLSAHDDLRAKEAPLFVNGPSNDTLQAEELDHARARVQRVEEQREDLKSGWLLGRQVLRVKVVRPMLIKPRKEEFLVSDYPRQRPHVQWSRYLGYLALWYSRSFTAYRIDDFDEPPFDLRELALAIERLAAVSSPWQTFFTKVRDIYTWNSPYTMRIMLAYWVLWYFEQLVTFGIGYVIFITIQNKIRPTSIESVRQRVERSQNQAQQVRAWGEIIQKHGPTDWIEPMFDLVGPSVQLQTTDLTIFLERLQNFYRWETPLATWCTLASFSAMFLFSLFSSLRLFVKVALFGAGCWFFYSCPVATNYPKYRHVVSPISWLFWGIPDSAELAIMRLQNKATTRDDGRLNELQNGSARQGLAQDPLAIIHASDTLQFKTILLPRHMVAHLILTHTHLVIKTENEQAFTYPYASLIEMRKVEINTDSNQESSSTDTNRFGRKTHITKWLEKATEVQLLPDGLGFVFLQDESNASDLQGGQFTDSTADHFASSTSPPQNPREPFAQGGQYPRMTSENEKHKTEFTLILNKSDRDKIFSVILGWSGLHWQPLYSMNRQNRLGNRDSKTGGNQNLDDAIKKALA